MSAHRSVRSLAAALGAAVLGACVLVTAPGVASAAPGPDNAPEYWFDTWHVPGLWGQGARGQGITIAEIDTGVNASLPELSGNVLSGKDFGQGGDGHIDREINTFGHGTAMASIMVARPGILNITGLAPDAKIIPIAVPLTGTTDAGQDDHLAEAIRYAVDRGSKIISMSLGGTRKPSTDPVPCPTAEQNAIYYALTKGAVLLASSGNTGLSGNSVEEPGVCLGVVSVGAADKSGAVASFSARHPYLTITAPGVNVPSLGRVRGSAFYGDGTSQATAIASAAFALVWSKYPQLSGRQLVARILATLDHRSANRDPGYGYGIVNPERAINSSGTSSAPNPVYSAADPFVSRYLAFANSAAASPPPPTIPDGQTGTVSVGHSPRLYAPRVIEGLAVSVAGLVAALALAGGAWIRRRYAAAQPELAEVGSPLRPRTPAVMVDDSGTEWHEIIDTQHESDSFL